MPLRRLYARMGAKHPAAYSNVTLALGVIMCMIVSVIVSVSAASNATRMSLERDKMSRDAQRRAACTLAVRMSEVYRAPSTPTGEQAGKAWEDLRREFRCDGTEEAPR